MRTPGFFRTFGHTFGHGLANELLDHLFPPPPRWSERFLRGLSDGLLSSLPFIIERIAPHAKEDRPPPSPFPFIPMKGKILGQFNCPKCGGHTWNTMGSDENGTYERYCTNGMETAFGEFNPNTVKEPCMFRWKATEDHLYFADPPADLGGTVTPPETRREPSPVGRTYAEEIQCGVAKAWPSTTPPTMESVEREVTQLRAAVGDRSNPGEWVLESAARLIKDADAHIARQAEKIRALIEDNEFQPNNGEVWVTGSDLAAHVPNLAHLISLPRLPLVFSNGRWYFRVGSSLEALPFKHVVAILEMFDQRAAPYAVGGAAEIDETTMAQNAAGGVA